MSRSNRFQSTLWDLQRRLGQNALVPLSALAEQAYLPTGYHALNDLLGGGLPTGKTTALVGAPSSGVTSLTYSLMAQAQTKDRAVVYLDLDTTLDAGYSARCGVALDRLLIVRLDDAEKSLEIMRTLVTAANVSLVVLDATGTDRLSTLLPQLPSALSRLKVGLARSSSVLLLVFQTLPRESVQANIDALLRLKRKAWLTCCDDRLSGGSDGAEGQQKWQRAGGGCRNTASGRTAVIACVSLPYFAAALEGCAPPLDTPLVVLQYHGQRGKVIACSQTAQAMGITRGISASRARALCPQAQFLAAEPARYQQAQDTLLNSLWEFTNRVEIDPASYPQTAVCYLDLGNLNADALTYLGDLIVKTLTERMGVAASVGIARARFVAFVAATTTRVGHVTLVECGSEAAFVADQPVDLLPLDKHQARRLPYLGIRTLGTLAAIPRASLLAQFGKGGALLHLLANGMDGRPVKPSRMPEAEAVRRLFEPLRDRERLDVRVWELAEALAEKLDQRRSALHQLTVSVHLERGKPAVQEMHLFEPVTSARAVGETVLTLLDRIKLAQPVTGIDLTASHLVPAMPKQLELFSGRPLRQQLFDLMNTLATQYRTARFYRVEPGTPESLLPERRALLQRIDAS